MSNETFTAHAEERIRSRRIGFGRAKEALEKGERFILSSGATFVRYKDIGLIIMNGVVTTAIKRPKRKKGIVR